MNQRQFTIVGCGLAGTLMACYLAKAGHRVDIYEKRPDPRRTVPERGRSINLALSVRGIHALGEVKLAKEVLHASILMRGRMIHGRDGALTFQPYGKDDTEALHSVSRAGLNLLLVEAAARHESVRLFFEHKCIGYGSHAGILEFAEQEKVSAEIVIASDGAYSAVRSQLERQDRFNYRQDYLSHGYKELTIPAGPGGAFLLEKNALHIWPRGEFMMIALPNADGSFTCTLFWPFDGPNGFAALTNEKEIVTYFRSQFPDVVPLIPTLAADFIDNPAGSLVTIRCQPWHIGGRVVLLGDACHAVVPFLGQGMNAAFEDCSVLNQCLDEESDDVGRAFARYETLRKDNLDTLADLCVENFYEMRDRVGSRWFVLRKKLALVLHRLFPRWYLPLYTMVEFTRIPYAAALQRARWQDRIVLIAGIGIALLILIGCFSVFWV
jgi:kynurenine 3-monooxygenase